MSTSELCLACCSSLPPKPTDLFRTSCCNLPICPSCISNNPRLVRYQPCLACLGGIGVVSAKPVDSALVNFDGAVRDEDNYVLGDDDSEDEDGAEPPTAHHSPPTTSSTTHISSSSKYYIKKGDTLQGIALRLSVDGRELCRLNKLPPSTLSTTPHILHTRIFLDLPPSAQAKLQPSDTAPNPAEVHAREIRRTRERAAKRLQTLTKEIDWRVADAYVALVDGVPSDEEDAFVLKQKELGTTSTSKIEGMAIDRYLDDMEWEADQLKRGATMKIPEYPIAGPSVQKEKSTGWW